MMGFAVYELARPSASGYRNFFVPQYTKFHLKWLGFFKSIYLYSGRRMNRSVSFYLFACSFVNRCPKAYLNPFTEYRSKQQHPKPKAPILKSPTP